MTDNHKVGGLLMVNIGHCIMQWSFVEHYLCLLFIRLHDGDREVADLIWGRIRSFEAKLQLLHEVSQRAALEPEMKRDWNLLREETLRLYRKRNQVAHSTPVQGSSEPMALEPFLSIYTDNKTIDIDDMRLFARQFTELAEALCYLMKPLFKAAEETGTPHPQSAAQVPGLVHRLRSEDDRRREAQRHRAIAWRQYLERNPDLKLD